jgi:hypothetical protein
LLLLLLCCRLCHLQKTVLLTDQLHLTQLGNNVRAPWHFQHWAAQAVTAQCCVTYTFCRAESVHRTQACAACRCLHQQPAPSPQSHAVSQSSCACCCCCAMQIVHDVIWDTIQRNFPDVRWVQLSQSAAWRLVVWVSLCALLLLCGVSGNAGCSRWSLP